MKEHSAKLNKALIILQENKYENLIKVAIKILQKDKIKDKDDMNRINREIRFLKKLRHNSIIGVHEVIVYNPDIRNS